MRKTFLHLLILTFAGIIINISCKKENSCEGCADKNKQPIAIAGPDRIITLPIDSLRLDGTGSTDTDGKISKWLWTKISGPASFNINKPSDSATKIKALVAGVYQFELKVTDNGGLSARDTMRIIVDSVFTTNHPPIANAGHDTTITLPAITVNLDGRESADPENNITSYTWIKISGPSSFNIINTNTVQTQVTNLIEGVYRFELKVTDASGLFSKDTMQVSVNTQPTALPVACDNSMRPVVNARLIPVGTLSQPRAAMAVASSGNKILFAGGIEASSGSWLPSSRVDIYDITNNTWSMAELCIGRYSIAATTAANKIFFGGGDVGDGTSPVDAVDIYDLASNTWTVSHLSASGNSIVAASLGTKVFFAGGDGGFSSDGVWRAQRVDIFDVNSNSWSTASLTEPKYGISAVTLNNKVYFSGGFAFTNISNRVEIFDNANNSWSLDSMYERKSHHGGIAAGDKIFWAGPSCLVEIKNVNTGNSSIEYLSKPAGWSSYDGQHLVLKDNKIIFLRKGFTDTDKFDIYDLTTNSWSIGILPQPVPFWSSFISVNNVIYIAGGSTTQGVSNQVWKLEF